MPPKKQPTPRNPSATPKPKPQFEVVDPVWLLKALALSLLAAILCAWLAVCLLFYQGQWQLVLHPTKIIDQTPATAGIPFQQLRFDSAETGQPRLTAWWIPAQPIPAQPVPAQSASTQLSFQPVPRYAAYTILYLHDGSLSLSATVPTLTRLHQAGLNVFALDYRGFGQSDPSGHPTEARMAQDTAAALDYLINIRHISALNIIPYGTGLGASLAVNLAHAHPELPAIILDNPDPDPTATAVAARPFHIVPVRTLFREHFDIATPLATLTTPKLLIAGGHNSTNETIDIRNLQTLYHHAASPSLTVTLPPIHTDAPYQAALTRFLDQYLPNHP